MTGHAGKQADLGTGQHRHHPRWGRPQELVVKLRPTSPTPRTHADTTEALSRASTEELLLGSLSAHVTQRTASGFADTAISVYCPGGYIDNP